MTVDAHIYALVEPIVNEVETAKTDGTVWKFRSGGDTFGSGHRYFPYRTIPPIIQG